MANKLDFSWDPTQAKAWQVFMLQAKVRLFFNLHVG